MYTDLRIREIKSRLYSIQNVRLCNNMLSKTEKYLKKEIGKSEKNVDDFFKYYNNKKYKNGEDYIFTSHFKNTLYVVPFILPVKLDFICLFHTKRKYKFEKTSYEIYKFICLKIILKYYEEDFSYFPSRLNVNNILYHNIQHLNRC